MAAISKSPLTVPDGLLITLVRLVPNCPDVADDWNTGNGCVPGLWELVLLALLALLALLGLLVLLELLFEDSLLLLDRLLELVDWLETLLLLVDWLESLLLLVDWLESLLLLRDDCELADEPLEMLELLLVDWLESLELLCELTLDWLLDETLDRLDTLELLLSD